MVVSRMSTNYSYAGRYNTCIPRNITSSSMNARELCENDDLATSIILDPIMGFTTHKMNTRFRPIKASAEDMIEVMNEFLCTANYEACFTKMISMDWAQLCYASRTLKQKQVGLMFMQGTALR